MSTANRTEAPGEPSQRRASGIRHGIGRRVPTREIRIGAGPGRRRRPRRGDREAARVVREPPRVPAEAHRRADTHLPSVSPRPMPDDLAFATVTQLADLLRRRALSSVELTRVTLDRLDRIGRVYNAVASLLPERARDEAERADAAFGRGNPVGPLHGIPYGAKDLLA